MAEAKDGIVTVVIDEKALNEALSRLEGLEEALRAKTAEACEKANAYGAAFETERTTVWATGEHVGGTAPEYRHDVTMGKKGLVGIVYTGNYAAIKDNFLHNTLLKVKG